MAEGIRFLKEKSEGSDAELQKERQGYIDLLVGALKRFYQEDAEEMFKGYPLDERTMVGCIARYVWCDRHHVNFNGLKQDVDVEYNKNHKSEAEIQDKVFAEEKSCCNKDECGPYPGCWPVIEQRIKERRKCQERHQCQIECKVECEGVDEKEYKCKFRPDMIVHERGASGRTGNGMIVEFKKAITDDEFEKAEEGKITFDFAKIRFCTCACRDYQYKIGAFVLLRRKMADVIIFAEKEPITLFSVTSDGEIAFDEKNGIHKQLRQLLENKSSQKEVAK